MINSRKNKSILITALIIARTTTTKNLKINKTTGEEINSSEDVKMKNEQEDNDCSKNKEGDFVNNKVES